MDLRDIIFQHEEAFSSPEGVFALLPTLDESVKEEALLYAIAWSAHVLDDAAKADKFDAHGVPLRHGLTAYERLGVPGEKLARLANALDFREAGEIAKRRKKYKEPRYDDSFPSGNFECVPYLDGIAIKRYVGHEQDIRVPEALDDQFVYAVLPGAFYGVQGNSLMLPSSLRIVFPHAFECCYINKIHFEDGDLVHIGEGAFSRSSLREVRLPGGLLSLDKEAFAYCANLSAVALPSSLLYLGPMVFFQSGIRSLHLSDKVSYVAPGLCDHCPYLEEFVASFALSSIGENAFRECRALSRVNLPSSLRTIGDSAFKTCTSLKSFLFPMGLTYIGKNAFAYLDVKRVDLPMSIRVIDEHAFEHCYVETLILPEGLEELHAFAFEGCFALNYASLPTSLRYFDLRAFGQYWHMSPRYMGTKEQWKKVKIVRMKGDTVRRSIDCIDGTASF